MKNKESDILTKTVSHKDKLQKIHFCSSYLGDNAMENIDQNEMECRRRLIVKTDLEKIIIVRSYAETREKTVDHKINILVYAVLATRERLLSIKEKTLNETKHIKSINDQQSYKALQLHLELQLFKQNPNIYIFCI